jgi:hypothetical protein
LLFRRRTAQRVGGRSPTPGVERVEVDGMRASTLIRSGLILIAFTALAVSCGSDDATAPDYQPEVVNTPNMSFSFQATGLRNVNDVLYYTWSNASGDVVIDPSTSTTGGTVRLEIRDSWGTTIYDGELPAGGDITPPPGAGGDSKIRLTLRDYTGTIGFALQMK